MEKTLVVLKPDAVKRGLMGEIISRFERVGLKMVGCKMIKVDRELADKHYPLDRQEFIEGMGKKTLDNYQKLGVDPKADFNTDDPYEIGKVIRLWLVEMITEGPVLAMVWQGPHAVEVVRKIAGHTLPLMASPGTIRGDFSFDSSYLSNLGKRAIRNLVHASGSLEEAEYEVSLWFKKEELHSYEITDEGIMI